MLEAMAGSRYCIIGAGAAGLASLHVLLGRGYQVDCFEKTDRVAGHWHTDYDALHLITSRDVSAFDDYPMPASYPVYPSRDQMRDYQQSFARNFLLYEHIRFGEEVIAVEPIGSRGSDGWQVRTSAGTDTTYAAVLVCNGHLWSPRLPTYEGTFDGKQLHSSEYRNARDIEGTRVLVVGAGNSGCDLAVDAAGAGLRTDISIRRGQVFQPKALFGRPRAELRWLARLPAPLQERMTRLLVNVALGRPETLGLPSPRTRNLNRQPPVVNSLLPYWVQHGRVGVVRGIRRLAGSTVEFVDGSSHDYDTIIWATGFNARFPFMDESLFSWRNCVPLRVGGLTVPVGLERMFLIGLCTPRGGQLPVYSAQAKLVVRLLEVYERTGTLIASRLGEEQVADDRMDIVRSDWLQQMQDTHAWIDRLGEHRERSGRMATLLRGGSH